MAGRFERGAEPERTVVEPCHDTSSVQALVCEHADFVWRSLRRLGVPEAMTDDATQEVFIVLQSKIESVRIGKERSFLFSIAMNVAAHVRRTLARRREADEEAAPELVDATPLADAQLDQREARALLDAVLDAMTFELRTIFVLFELEEMTMAQIAEAVGIPAGTVASRLRRAREEFHAEASRLLLRNERMDGRLPPQPSSLPTRAQPRSAADPASAPVDSIRGALR